MFSFEKVNREYVALGIGVLVIVIVVCFAWQKDHEKEARLQKAIVMSQQDAQDKNVLQNKLELSKQNAEMLDDFISRVQVGGVQPVAHFTVQAPSVEQAGEEVTSRINGRDLALPSVALEKTDNTIVTTEKLNEQQQAAARKVNEKNAGTDKPKMNEEYGVGVYKNNNYRNWEWSVGYGRDNGEGYIPIGLQRNYSKDTAIAVEVHLDADRMKSVTGWEVRQVWKTDKLFLLF
jgi:hypothetical protein